MQLNSKKIKITLVTSVIVALAMPVMASAQSPESISRKALDLAGNQKFEQALSLLDAQSQENRSTYDVQFARARILSWADQHEAAANAYKDLMNAYPGNPDVENGYGYLEYYRGNYDQADIFFNNIIANHPNYDDARTGLERTQAAREAAKRNRGHQWRVDGNVGISSFSNGQQDWNDQSLRVEYIPGKIAVSGKVVRYERFGLNDIQLTAGVRSNNDSNWDWEIGGGFTPSADFRPDVSALGRIGHKFKLQGGTTLHGSVGYQIDDYDSTGSISTLTPQIMAYLENGAVLTGRLIHSMKDGQSDQTGFLTSASIPIVDRLSAQIGYANAPETVNGIVIDTESVFGGLTYQLTDTTDIHATYARDDRENTYIRDGFNVGLTQKY